MPISGYFDTVFAVAGDRVAVPDPVQGGGTVSYDQGYPIGYSTPVGSGGILITRTSMNQLFFDLTSAVQNWQQNTIAPFITTTMNGGTPFSYPQYAMVLSGGVGYISNTGGNTDTPPSSKWNTIPFSTNSFYSGGLSTGSANIQVVATLSPAGFSLSNDGSTVCCTAGFTNTGATTFALGGTSATAVKKWNGSSYVALTGGEIRLDETIFLSRNVTEACLVLTDAPTLGTVAVLNTDGTNFTASAGNLAFGSAPVLPSATTGTTQASTDSSTKLATTAFVQSLVLPTPFAVGSMIIANNVSGSTVSAGGTTSGSNLVVCGFSNEPGGELEGTGDTVTGTWQALQTLVASSGSSASAGLWQRIS